MNQIAEKILDISGHCIPSGHWPTAIRMSQFTRDLTGSWFQPRCWPAIGLIVALSVFLVLYVGRIYLREEELL